MELNNFFQYSVLLGGVLAVSNGVAASSQSLQMVHNASYTAPVQRAHGKYVATCRTAGWYGAKTLIVESGRSGGTCVNVGQVVYSEHSPSRGDNKC